MSIVEDPYARRVVDPRWVRKVHQVVRRPLMGYQSEGAGWMASRLAMRKGCILGDEPGLGKTTQTLAALAAVNAFPALIVCPTSVKENWARELHHLRPRLSASIVEGKRGSIQVGHLVIANYALLQSRERQFAGLRAKALVFDEAHLLKEPRPSKVHRAAVATRLAHHIKSTVLLTGSPILNRPQEFWRLLHMIDPEEWESYVEYTSRYCSRITDEDSRHQSVETSHGRAKNVTELRVRAAPYILRRRSRSVLKSSLPPKHVFQRKVVLEEIDRTNYEAAEKDVVAWLRTFAGDLRASRAAHGQAVVKMNMLRRIAAVGKLRRALGEYLRTWFSRQRRPLVVFGYHRQVLNGVAEICERLGVPYSRVRGSDTSQRRQEQVDLFDSGKTMLFLAPLKSAGVGINLQYRSSDILCLERLWTPSLMGQAEGRCWRLGQRRDVTVTYLDAENTVDEHIARVLASKQVLIDAVVDGSLQRKREKRDAIVDVINSFAKDKGIDLRSSPS